MRLKFQHTKPLADLLTASRVLMAIQLILLGLTRSSDGLHLAVLLVLISWLTDLLDGRLARRDPNFKPTWIGDHDAEVDLVTSVGVAAYLVFSGYLATWLGLVIVVFLLVLWILHSRQLAWPIYALPYVLLLITAFQDAPLLAWVMVGYLLVTSIIQMPRLSHEHLPEFFQALDSLRKRRN
jgi:hypothetical protein